MVRELILGSLSTLCGDMGAVLENLSENMVPWKQFGASRRSYFCEKLFGERPKLISYVCVRAQDTRL